MFVVGNVCPHMCIVLSVLYVCVHACLFACIRVMRVVKVRSEGRTAQPSLLPLSGCDDCKWVQLLPGHAPSRSTHFSGCDFSSQMSALQACMRVFLSTEHASSPLICFGPHQDLAPIGEVTDLQV